MRQPSIYRKLFKRDSFFTFQIWNTAAESKVIICFLYPQKEEGIAVIVLNCSNKVTHQEKTFQQDIIINTKIK